MANPQTTTSKELAASKQLMWDQRFLALANHVKSWSKDPSTQVGALVVSPDRRQIIPGYNGFPRGMADEAAMYRDRETKYKRVLHAEENAIINAQRDLVGYTLYSPMPPCIHCALLAIQSGITRCVVELPTTDMLSRWGDSIQLAKDYFFEANVEYVERLREPVNTTEWD